MRIRRHVLLVGVALLGFASANAQRDEKRIYSDVRYNDEGGDLLGTELELTIKGDRIDGRLKIYQGGCASPVQVAGSLSGNDVHVSGQSDVFGEVDITAAVHGGDLSGFLQLEKAQSSEKIRLKRIVKPHC